MLLIQTFLIPYGHASAVTSTKKGIGITARQVESIAIIRNLNVSWYYNWAPAPILGSPVGVEFVPMIWGRVQLENLVQHKGIPPNADAKWPVALGFNEPDSKAQANMSVAKALGDWPKIGQLARNIGSPAPKKARGPWMREFMASSEKSNLKIDFVAVHWYGPPDVKKFKRWVRKIHEVYKKPIWITEFAVADWSVKPNSTNKYSADQIRRFMQSVTKWLNDFKPVERYAWFTGRKDIPALTQSRLWKPDGTLTQLGEDYSSLP